MPQHAATTPRAKKSLGQNFLQDANIARKIVNTLHIAPGDMVVEIGPGPGALTTFLHDSPCSRLVLVEKDNELARVRMVEGKARATGKQFSVVLTDALTMPWQAFSMPWKCVGNLPYNVASPLMWEIFSRAQGLERAVFMIQKEVGQRIVAAPHTGAYGALSVWVQSFMRPRLEFIVPPHVFFPRPKVDSAVLSFVPHPAGTYTFSPDALSWTLKRCFQMRRKQLGSILKANGSSPELLEQIGINPQCRPEELSPARFHTLAEAWFFSGKH